MQLDSLQAISPLDGRYHQKTKNLSKYFSESALIKYRVMVEIEYLIALSKNGQVKEVKRFNDKEIKKLQSLHLNFSLKDAQRVKEIEKTTNHDVKSVEYFIKEKMEKLKLTNNLEFVHFALTSEDISNLAYSLMLKEGIEQEILPNLEKILAVLKRLAKQNKSVALLSLTHGQPATPTTLGKEMAVFYFRLLKQVEHLSKIKLEGKLNGAVGNYAAANIAYPQVDWLNFSQRFVKSFNLQPNLLTTQVEPHDSAAQVYQTLIRINNIIRDLNQDIWLYISRGIFRQKRIKGEVGSSTMPHKINPWKFENSDGNLIMANAILNGLADKLPISKLQRDLSDSTSLRNQGVALGYSLLAVKSTLNGLSRLEVDKKKIAEELNNNWEVLAEAIQTVLRKVGYNQPYEKLKQLTRGEKITREKIREFIKGLDIDKREKDKLLKLAPGKYIGQSEELVRKFVI